MARAKWDVDGTRKFHAGVSHGMVYLKADEGTANGAAWNGLTGVTESPSGAEPTDLWADNMKYARLISGENYGFTIEAYMYPEEFEACDGLAAPVKGIRIGQQKRKAFGFSWQTKVGTDDDADKGYIIHVVWNATAQPSEKSHETMNDSPDAETFSWECDTVHAADRTGRGPDERAGRGRRDRQCLCFHQKSESGRRHQPEPCEPDRCGSTASKWSEKHRKRRHTERHQRPRRTHGRHRGQHPRHEDDH